MNRVQVFFKNRIRIESARVRGSNKDERDVFLADSTMIQRCNNKQVLN